MWADLRSEEFMASQLVKIEGSYYPRTVVEAALSAEPVPTFNPGDIACLTLAAQPRYTEDIRFKRFMVLGPEINTKLGGCLKTPIPAGFVRVLDGNRTRIIPLDMLTLVLKQWVVC